MALFRLVPRIMLGTGRVMKSMVIDGAKIGYFRISPYFRNFSKAILPQEMAEGEALNVLALNRGYTSADVDNRFKHWFDANDPSRGGSLYIQSKIVMARDTLLR